MATFVGSFAASHAPLLVRDWDLLSEPLQERFTRDFRELGRRISAARPDVLVVIAPDHWENFFLNSLPAIAIGVGAEHTGPSEPFMKPFPFRPIVGDAAFANFLLEAALTHEFDPVASHHLTLDHGFCIPLWRSELAPLPRIVPIVINALQEPMPTLTRMVHFGEMLRGVIERYPADVRIAVLGTGGLSHSIGEATMGQIDEEFDRVTIDALSSDSDETAVVGAIETALRTTGNGAHEVRCWLVAQGAAGNADFELIDYVPCPEVYVGCAFGSWPLTPSRVFQSAGRATTSHGQ